MRDGKNKTDGMSTTEMPKEDPARRAGYADDAKGKFPKVIESAKLAIEDCEEKYETPEEESKE